MLLPIRNFAQAGVVADIDAYDMSLESVGMAVNARLENGRAERGPVYRATGAFSLDPASAGYGINQAGIRWMFSVQDAQGSTQTHVVDNAGGITLWVPSGSTNFEPPTWIPDLPAIKAKTDPKLPVTHTTLADVVYVNRPDREPFYYSKTVPTPVYGDGYAEISLFYVNGGNSDTKYPDKLRFNALRAVGNVLVGLNVTKTLTTNGKTEIVNFPNTVRWSDYSDQGLPPRNWDVTGNVYKNGVQQQSSAGGENTLSDMDGVLVDGCKLGNNLILYSTKEAWMMEPTYGGDIFSFRRLFGSGILNVNCAVEREGVHYVFGTDDIYIHDGNSTTQSIAQGRVRNFIFNNLVRAEAHRCFAVHNKTLNEILFYYVSADPYCKYPYTPGDPNLAKNVGVNRAAVYNYAANEGKGAWYFYDVPYAGGATSGPSDTVGTYSTAYYATYESTTATYATVGAGTQANPLLVGVNPLTVAAGGTYETKPAAVFTFAPPEATGSAAADPVYNAPLYLEKIGIDFDEVRGLPLGSYKLLSSLDIEGTISPGSAPVYVTVGASDQTSNAPIWGVTQTYEPEWSRIDANQTGRFLALRMTYDDVLPLRISGLDINVSLIANR